MMKKQFFGYFLLTLLTIGTGCSKSYFDINNNPNSAVTTTPELVLPNALKVTVAYQLTGYTYLSGWMGYWAPSGSYATSSSDVASYKQTTDSYTGSWGYYYDNLEDYDYIEKQGIAQGKPFYTGAAKIMKTFIFQQLVDMYNNIPYSNALLGTSAIQPTYDKGQDVYAAITNQLDTAIALMQNQSISNISGGSDILFRGSTTKWIQFANTLRLRILMRQTQVSGADITGGIAKIKANGAGFLTTDATVNPGTSASSPGYAQSAGQQNPTYGYFRTITNNPTSGGQADYWRANQYSINFLQNNNDPRLSRIYASVNGQYLGNVLGSATNIPGNGSSSFGPGILKSPSQDAILLTGAESYFLQAEANVRSYLGATTDVVKNFDSGVQASFSYLGAGSAASYYSQGGNKQVNITACTTAAEQIACIIRQKWVAENSITPFEAWCDYRRLGLPSDIPLSVSPYKDGPNIPVRILYPTSEYSNNSANVNAQGAIDGHSTKVFWMP